jgi:hypothetical protein
MVDWAMVVIIVKRLVGVSVQGEEHKHFPWRGNVKEGERTREYGVKGRRELMDV